MVQQPAADPLPPVLRPHHQLRHQEQLPGHGQLGQFLQLVRHGREAVQPTAVPVDPEPVRAADQRRVARDDHVELRLLEMVGETLQEILPVAQDRPRLIPVGVLVQVRQRGTLILGLPPAQAPQEHLTHRPLLPPRPRLRRGAGSTSGNAPILPLRGRRREVRRDHRAPAAPVPLRDRRAGAAPGRSPRFPRSGHPHRAGGDVDRFRPAPLAAPPARG
nr:hypothetical protein [Streptomyces alkaliphilus]